ncbi:GDSL-type esterase/lipase family protein [Psychrobacillus sp. OK032]|uniref:GDSL-type esterase/lipase family protein n=1 Tax=Psychrobacillus sp. OK032 TaxID=1884358 RepID=UPI0008BB1626|nr:GDSL-type esterase/lipase family protein [Psychrobacillus sp. OK032]SES24166.1 Lysophospholipase L1 [Psychrobacillus sp. OK032]
MKIGFIGDSLTDGRPGVSFFHILKERYPTVTLVNLGKPGETVKSLHVRLTKTKLATDYDLIFLWIGVNDVYSKLLSIQAQPVVNSHEEFKEVYQQILDMIIASSRKVVTVSPSIVGEDLQNSPNQETNEFASLIESISKKKSVDYVNIQAVFKEHLVKVNSSDYISTNPMRVMLDVFFYKKPTKIDKLSKKRGLHLTLDGIHLNSTGAQIVADVYATNINQL